MSAERCKYVVTPENADNSMDHKTFWRNYGVASCWRETWRGDRCIWHAETGDKPLDKLLSSHRDGWSDTNPLSESDIPEWEYIGGAILPDSNLTHEFNLDGAVLHWCQRANPDKDSYDVGGFFESNISGADLSRSKLPYTLFLGSDATNANFRVADLNNASMPDATLNNAFFRAASLQNANLEESDAVGADFIGADLSEANLGSANISAAKMRGAEMEQSELRSVKAKDTDFSGVHLSQSVLWNANFENADFTNAVLTNADLSGANLTGADLTNATLHNADLAESILDDATLTNADLSDADLSEVSLRDANLEGADLSQVDAGGADFRNAEMRKTRLQRIHIDSDTKFGRRCIDDKKASTSTEADEAIRRLENAVSVYRSYQRLLRENSLPAEIPKYYIFEKHARRRLARKKGEWSNWIKYNLSRGLMLYGESPWRVVASSLLIMLLFGLLYPFVGGVKLASGGEAVNLSNPLLESVSSISGGEFVVSIYFSMVTFSTLGYGDIMPNGAVVQILAAIEAFIGAILIALFVVVLGRRVLR